MKICIDFQGGSHGNFLEFVCNIVAGVSTNDAPFNSHGASHNKIYYSEKLFFADHYSFNNTPINSNKIVSVKIDPGDLLTLSMISLLRAGDYGYDNDKLEIDTYNKLNNIDYRWVLDTIVESFFANQVGDSYNAVKDPSWPEVTTMAEFNALPAYIKQECINDHNLQLVELNELHPDCPRHILREFFQIGFLNPESHGFITQQMHYQQTADVYNFSFSKFYNTDAFLNEIKQIALWADLHYNNWNKVVELHTQFLNNQPYKNSKVKCDQIVQQIINGNGDQCPKVNLLEEAYINATLIKNGYECRY